MHSYVDATELAKRGFIHTFDFATLNKYVGINSFISTWLTITVYRFDAKLSNLKVKRVW